MNSRLVSLLRCANGCESELDLQVTGYINEHEVETGTLTCGICRTEYPIQEGIARILPRTLFCNQPMEECEKSGAVAHKLSEMRARDAQVDDYDRMWYLNLFGKAEIPFTLRHLSPRKGHLMLEGGCGTGRMTPSFAHQCDSLISVDFSWESLRSCASKLRKAGIRNVSLIQADICHLPFKSEIFDRVASCQVLEHIPTHESRTSAVAELSRVLRNDGRLVLSAYQHSLFTRIFGSKEGQHDGGIYYYRFAREELCELLSRNLVVEKITGAMVYHFIARCRKEKICADK